MNQEPQNVEGGRNFKQTTIFSAIYIRFISCQSRDSRMAASISAGFATFWPVPLLKGELKAHIHICLYESNTLQE